MSGKSEIVRDALRRFPLLPKKSVARYILHEYGDSFDGNLEAIRSAIRYQTGSNGELSRRLVKNPLERTPVKMPQTWRRQKIPYRLEPGLWLVLSDLHVPFHEQKPIESAIRYGQDNKVTGVFINGDLQDCAAITYWPSVINRKFDKEIELVIDFLDFLEQELPVKTVYKAGNHEYRLPRLFASRVPELIGLPLQAMDTVLGLEYRGIELVDYYQIVHAGKLPILHGHEVRRIDRAVNPARGLFLKTKSWAACSHCHTTSENSARNIQDTYLTTWSFGCLCDLHPDYQSVNDWNWGTALLNVEKNGAFEIVNKRILANGKVV
jgi:hypothetical protein